RRSAQATHLTGELTRIFLTVSSMALTSLRSKGETTRISSSLPTLARVTNILPPLLRLAVAVAAARRGRRALHVRRAGHALHGLGRVGQDVEIAAARAHRRVRGQGAELARPGDLHGAPGDDVGRRQEGDQIDVARRHLRPREVGDQVAGVGFY